MKKVICLLLSALLLSPTFGQKKNDRYEIKVHISGISDTVLYLGHYFGDKKYVVDTTVIDSKGDAVFAKDKKLNRGIYIVVMPSRNMTFFEILMPDDQIFSIRTDTAAITKNMHVKGCDENEVFIAYHAEMEKYGEQRQALNKRFETADSLGKIAIIDEINALAKDRENYIKKIVADKPNYFFSRVLKSMLDVDIPEAPKDEQGKPIDPSFQYKYFKQHYFDNVDFTENGLLRTPIFESKLNYYFDKMVIPLPDSVIPEAKDIIQRTYDAGDSLVYQYTVSHLLNYFETSKVMGYDAVFVAIAEDWYLSGKAPWADSTFMSKLKERVDKITPNTLGSVAPDLVRMQTDDDRYMSLHQVDADYTVLVFYEPNCGHCKKEIPKLVNEFRDTLKAMNVKIFAVYTQYDRDEWIKFLDDKNLREDGWYNVWDGPYPHTKFRDFYDIYSTPVLFVLDKDKTIIGKRIGIESIKGLLEFDKKMKAEKAEKADK